MQSLIVSCSDCHCSDDSQGSGPAELRPAAAREKPGTYDCSCSFGFFGMLSSQERVQAESRSQGPHRTAPTSGPCVVPSVASTATFIQAEVTTKPSSSVADNISGCFRPPATMGALLVVQVCSRFFNSLHRLTRERKARFGKSQSERLEKKSISDAEAVLYDDSPLTSAQIVVQSFIEVAEWLMDLHSATRRNTPMVASISSQKSAPNKAYSSASAHSYCGASVVSVSSILALFPPILRMSIDLSCSQSFGDACMTWPKWLLQYIGRTDIVAALSQSYAGAMLTGDIGHRSWGSSGGSMERSCGTAASGGAAGAGDSAIEDADGLQGVETRCRFCIVQMH